MQVTAIGANRRQNAFVRHLVSGIAVIMVSFVVFQVVNLIQMLRKYNHLEASQPALNTILTGTFQKSVTSPDDTVLAQLETDKGAGGSDGELEPDDSAILVFAGGPPR